MKKLLNRRKRKYKYFCKACGWIETREKKVRWLLSYCPIVMRMVRMYRKS